MGLFSRAKGMAKSGRRKVTPRAPESPMHSMDKRANNYRTILREAKKGNRYKDDW